MAFLITEPFCYGQQIDATTTAVTVDGATRTDVPLGTIVRAQDPTYGVGEFIYLLGVASTVVGSVVVIDAGVFGTTLASANAKGQIGVAMSINVASQYGWYQISGFGVAKVLTGFADGGLCYLTSTAGSVDDAAVTGDLVHGMVGTSAIGTPSAGLAQVSMSRPIVTDTDAVS
jgi:hypothetical protein